MNLSPPSDFPLSAFTDNQEAKAEDSVIVGKNEKGDPKQKAQYSNREDLHFGVRSTANERFVWNLHLLKPVMSILHLDWILHIVHGFVDQCNVSVYGRSLYLTLIARRSNKYAGTRFLKRGANFEVRIQH